MKRTSEAYLLRHTGGADAIAEQFVEHVTAEHGTVARQLGVGRPRLDQLAACGDHPDPLDPARPGQERIDVEQLQLGERTRGEHVAACLVPRDGTLLDDGHGVATLREPQCDRGARRPAADHEHVGVERAHDSPLTPT